MKTVVVGMSGGVDSSVAAYLLKEQGYNVIGVTMQIWDNKNDDTQEDGGCCGLSAVDDARRVAKALDIPYYVMNFREEFQNKVINYFIEEYSLGRTPNPCIACNRYVKWESLLEKSLNIGADYIATGHYARIIKYENNRYGLETSATQDKDQTYALYNLTQEQLSKTLMPVGEYTKEEIRDMAKKISVRIANKPDSQEICFVPDNDYAKFIKENSDIQIAEGNFVDLKGKIIGRHKGITHYTVGQRKGLGLSLGKPVYVVEINPKTNEVVIGTNDDVFGKSLIAKKLSFMPFDRIKNEMKFEAKIRYSHKAAKCVVKPIDDDTIEVVFEEKQRAITPGQAVVLYDGNKVVGGGTII